MTTRPARLAAASLGLAAALLGAAPGPARAADNVPGKPYENRLIGFRFRPLNEWASVPPGTDPKDPQICGFYCDAAKFAGRLNPECSVFAFPVPKSEPVATPSVSPGADPAPPPDGEPAPPVPPTTEEAREQFLSQFRLKSVRQVIDRFRSQVQQRTDQALSRMDEKKRKKVLADIKLLEPTDKEIKTDDGVLVITEAVVAYPLSMDDFEEIRIVAGTIRNEEYEVGVVYRVPGSSWRKYGQGVYSSLKSMEFMAGVEIAAARKDLEDALAGKTGDERWLEEIKRKVGPGWDYLQTKNYLIVYDKNVKPDRVRLIAVQIEAIRKDVYEVMFPPDRPVTAISVVRVCKDAQQYSQYGGPGGSAGYWNSGAQELVFFEDTSKKKDALRVLNHEAFHQFIFYSVGSISPHDWFNEGHGDYFSGHNYDSSGRFVAKPFDWRTGIIKSAMGSKTYVPLKVFVTYSHAQYYHPSHIGQNYAQGWSLIWFMRRTRNPEWKGMLETYFNTLKGEVTKWVDEQVAAAKTAGTWTEGWKPPFTPDDVEENARQKALDSIFGGWDDRKWERFEREWKDAKW